MEGGEYNIPFAFLKKRGENKFGFSRINRGEFNGSFEHLK